MQFNPKAVALQTAVIGTLMAAAAAAQAAIPASVGTAFAEIETDANTLFDTVVPYVVGVLGLMVVIKLIKRFGSKI